MVYFEYNYDQTVGFIKWTVWHVSYIPVKQLSRDNDSYEAKQALPADNAWPWNKPLRYAWLTNEWMN